MFRIASPRLTWSITSAAIVAWALNPGSTGDLVIAESPAPMAKLPLQIPDPEADGVIYIDTPTGKRATNIDSELQERLTKYLERYHSPVAAVAVIDAKDGRLLALAQGAPPAKWGGKVHTGLHPGFPAASLFKTVVTTAAFELADIDAKAPIGLWGGCANVRASGVWMRDGVPGRVNRMNLRRAYGRSCNGFFAKLSVNHLGLGIITNFARRYGWESGIPADFHIERSPFRPPNPENTSTHTVGRFAAGFGYVGISAVHAAWMMLTIAQDGDLMPVRIFRDTPLPPGRGEKLFSAQTAEKLRGVMDATVRGGTASFAFRRRPYRKIRELVGGKTGTLTGKSPKGLTTWFAGMMPLESPEVVVAAVVILEDRWFIKGPNLAAEALMGFQDMRSKRRAQAAVLPKDEARLHKR